MVYFVEKRNQNDYNERIIIMIRHPTHFVCDVNVYEVPFRQRNITVPTHKQRKKVESYTEGG